MLLYGERLRMLSSEERTEEVRAASGKEKNTYFIQHTLDTHKYSYTVRITLTLHTSEDTDTQTVQTCKVRKTCAHTQHSPSCTHTHVSTLFYITLVWGGELRAVKQEAKSTVATPTALNYMNVVVSHLFHNLLWDEAIKHAFCCHDVRDIYYLQEL